MTHPISDERYSPPDLDLHYLFHGVMVTLYLLSVAISWGLSFHPFDPKIHAILMVVGAIFVAGVAYGAPYAAELDNSPRMFRAYTRYISPILGVVSVLGLAGLWMLAFSESFAGSVFTA